MQWIPLSVWLFQMVPESVALSASGTVLTGVRVRACQIVAIGVIQSVAAYAIRHLPFYYGFHTALLLIVLGLLVMWICGVSFARGMLASLVAFAILSTIESLLVMYLIPLTRFDLEVILGYPSLRILFGLVSPFVMAVAVLVKVMIERRRGVQSHKDVPGKGVSRR